nr:RNA-directed DNA polymerase [Tanacetum cinerariifolium]
MSSSILTPNSLLSYTKLKPIPKSISHLSKPSSFIPKASLSIPKETVLKSFNERKALKIISGLQNFDKENVASVVTAADKGGATHVDIACDPELVKLVISLTRLPVCVSSVDPSAFLAAVEAGASMKYFSSKSEGKYLQELDLDDNWDIVSADFDDSSVYSISEGEGDTHQNISVMVQDAPVEEIAFMAIEEDDESDSDQEEEYYQPSHHTFMFHPGPPTKIAEMVQAVGSWKPNKELPVKKLLKEKTEQVQQMIKDQAKEYYENKAVMQKQEELWQTERSLLVRDLTDALKIIDQLKAEQMKLEEIQFKNEEIKKLKAQLQERKEEVEVQFSEEEFPPMEAEIHHFGNATSSPKVRKVTNQLYNVKVEFDIPDCSTFGTTAIIDTRSSACCINKKVVPKEALEPLTDDVFFNGLNSRQQATHKIKQGNFLIEGNKFRIPLIYAFDMNDSNGIEMLIGADFLRSMKGGIRIEGDEITINKKVTKIKTSNQTEISEIAELEVNEEEFLETNESIYFNQEGSKAFLEQFKPVIERLKHQGYIGEEPLKHWKKNGEFCKLDIINPDVTIEDRPLKPMTPAMEDTFKKHVDSLLKIGAIRPSKSRHRTMAMIVNSGTTIDPVTGKEVNGKERMVFNYKSLNDNTYKDQYSLPGIT